MSRTAYTILTDESRVVVLARSGIHDTTATWDRVSGRVEADLDDLGGKGAAAVEVTVDMTHFDAGDFLRNRKLNKDLAIARHPKASFELQQVREVDRADDGRFSAVGEGVLRWRDREVTISARGEGVIDESHLEATARFDLDVRDLGVTPPRFLMLKVADVVEVEVRLRARAD